MEILGGNTIVLVGVLALISFVISGMDLESKWFDLGLGLGLVATVGLVLAVIVSIVL